MDQLHALIAEVEKREVKAAVASQWYYSDVPLLLKREIQRRCGSRGVFRKAEIEFSKEGGLAYATPPPLLEMPHVLQLISSCGLVDMAVDKPKVTGDKDAVFVEYTPKHALETVSVICKNDYKPAPELMSRYPNWDVQIRTFKVWFENDNEL